MASVDQVFDKIENGIKQLPPSIQELFNKVEQATHVKRAYIASGLIGLFGLYMILGYFAELLCNFIGFLIPAYYSMRAIESSSKEDDTRWLTYWVVFAVFSVFDFFADQILRYFPFYWLGKLIFLGYCFAPMKENGSQKIYSQFIRPYFLKNQGSVDNLLKKGGEAMKGATDALNNFSKKD